MRAALVSLLAPLALCAVPPPQIWVTAPRETPKVVELNPSLHNNEKHPPLFTAELIEALVAEDERTPGDYSKFEKVFRDAPDKKQLQLFKDAVENSMIDVPVYGIEAVWKQKLIDNPAECLSSALFSDQMFEFFEFIAFACNRTFLNILLNVMKIDLVVQLFVLAALYNIPNRVNERFNGFETMKMFANMRNGKIQLVIASDMFASLYRALILAANTDNQKYLKHWYARIGLEDKIAFYAECAKNSFFIPDIIYTALPVSFEVYKALVFHPDLKMTMALRNILSHVMDLHIRTLNRMAMANFNNGAYDQYLKIVLWLPKVDQINIPKNSNDRKRFADAIINANTIRLSPAKAKLVCSALQRMDETKKLVKFLDVYLERNVAAEEIDQAVALIWHLKQEKMFVASRYFSSLSFGGSAARIIANAHRAGLSLRGPRVSDYINVLQYLGSFNLEDLRQHLMIEQAKINASVHKASLDEVDDQIHGTETVDLLSVLDNLKPKRLVAPRNMLEYYVSAKQSCSEMPVVVVGEMQLESETRASTTKGSSSSGRRAQQ